MYSKGWSMTFSRSFIAGTNLEGGALARQAQIREELLDEA